MLRGLVIIGFIIMTVFLLLIILVYLVYKKRAEIIEEKLKKINIVHSHKTDDFILKNPYQYEGSYKKAQLHVHSSKSDGKLKVDQLVSCYKELGYSFLAITDHNKVIDYKKYNTNNFVAIAGEELTVIDPFWPFGRHINRLFIKKHLKDNRLDNTDNILKKKGINIINHPVTVSGLGTQRWDIEKLMKLKNIKFIEIFNHYSDQNLNIKYWHLLLKKYGHNKPIWGLAVDDTHKKKDINKGWIMAKVDKIESKNLYQALNRGSFYCTQGPNASFEVSDKCILISLDNKSEITFINADNKVLKKETALSSNYQVRGDEGFVRVEAENINNKKKLWSQPFWLIDQNKSKD